MNLLNRKKFYLFFAFLLIAQQFVLAQTRIKNNGTAVSADDGTTPTITTDSKGRPIKTGGKDSLQKRDQFADSITIYYRYFDSSRNRRLDSNINDFSRRFPIPWNYVHLGNYGTAARNLIFNPLMKDGWDAGFHQYDIYNYDLEKTRFFQTTRPYTELIYLLGSKAEQTIGLMHTQNKKSNFNFAFDYRFLNAPGSYKNQNSSHSNLRFNAFYQTNNKRYGAYLIFLSNSHRSSENGGVRNIKNLDTLSLNDPYELETRIGLAGVASRNPFSTNITTGNIYKNSTVMFRHYYDLGTKDSLVTDSVTTKLFYPRIRIQHTFKLTSYSYNFIDNNVDTANYRQYFNYNYLSPDIPLSFKDEWKNINNELSIVSFPEKNNLNQFLKIGAAFESLQRNSIGSKDNYSNLYLLAEYRNRTRNQKWDVEASGNLYISGLNAGDYNALISLKRELSKKAGSLEVGFNNVNRTPSFIYSGSSSFQVTLDGDFKKENYSRLFAKYDNAKYGFSLTGDYYLMTNYAYFDSFFSAKQESTLFNVLHIGAEKRFGLAKNLNWYTELHLQQTTGDAPVKVPFLLTRNRLVFEGNFFKNLFLALGLEVRYYTNYKAAGYSPFNGQFFLQTNYTTANKPDINAFLHFRIKSFKGFIRLENINTYFGKGEKKYNFSTPNYPSEPSWFRAGVWWNFVN